MKTSGGALLLITMGIVFVGVSSSSSASKQQESTSVRSGEKLPPDIHPDTLSRMPRATRDQFTTDEDREAFDHLVTAEPRFGKPPENGVLGSTGTRLQIPVVADAYRIAVHNLEQKNGLEQKYIELAAMIASREANGEEPWVSHEGAAVKLNSREIVEIIRDKKDTKGLGEKDATIIQFGRQMIRGPKVTSKTFADMERLFGRRGTLAIALIMDHYVSNALLYRVYDQHLPAGKNRPYPDVLATEAEQKNQ